MLSSFSI